MTGKNVPGLSPNFIGNLRILSVAFATVSVYPENARDATIENVANDNSCQQNVTVAMCQVKYLFQLFWSVIHQPMRTN